MKNYLIILFLLQCFIFNKLFSQDADSYIKSQVIEFSNLKTGDNYSSGEIYCFGQTKVTIQMRASNLHGKYDGTILFSIGSELYPITGQNEDFFKVVTLSLPKGKTLASITLLPNLENRHMGDISISIIDSNKGSVGTRNTISTIDR